MLAQARRPGREVSGPGSLLELGERLTFPLWSPGGCWQSWRSSERGSLIPVPILWHMASSSVWCPCMAFSPSYLPPAPPSYNNTCHVGFGGPH